MVRSILVACLFLFFIHYTKRLQAQDASSFLDSLVTSYLSQEDPGLAVGVVKDGQVIYETYAGQANLEHNVPVDSLTRFNIASNGKQFTALIVWQLISEGKLSLDDDFRRYLPDYYPNYEGRITVGHLLTHTSGIRDVYDLWALQGKTWWKLFVNNRDALKLLKNQKELNFEPGTQYLYSNSNYLLLTALVEELTGETFSSRATALFDSLDMLQTAFLSNYMKVVPHKARPYGNWNGWIEYPSVTGIHGDGALYTTLGDQLQWERTVQLSNQGRLPGGVVDQSQSLLHLSTEYGYGVMHDTYKGKRRLYHDGNTGAYNATFFRFPDERLSVVVMSNNGNIPTHRLAMSVSDHLLGLNEAKRTYPAGPDKITRLKNISDITGSYETDGGSIIRIVEKSGSLYRELYQAEPVQLVNEKGNLFHYESNPDLKIAFEKDKKGRSTFTIYLSSQEPIRALKLPEFQPDQSYFSALNGRYVNEETDTEILLEHTGGSTFSVTKNGKKKEGELLTKDYLRMNSYEITVHRNPGGKVDALLIDNGRIRNVRFAKLSLE